MHNTIAILSVALPTWGGILYAIGTWEQWDLIVKVLEVLSK